MLRLILFKKLLLCEYVKPTDIWTETTYNYGEKTLWGSSVVRVGKMLQ